MAFAVLVNKIDVSIPQGTIKSLCRRQARFDDSVSIPQGTIKRKSD